MEVIKENICYALLREDTEEIHPIAHERHDLNWYPETRLTLLGTIDFRPTVRSVVTENPYIISCYERKDVRVWVDGEWIMPDIKTFGCSVDIIMDQILGVSVSIPNIANEVIQLISRELDRMKD